MIKRIFAIIAIIFITAWVIATFVIAIAPIPGKAPVFTFMMIGCIFFPIMLWVILWMITFLTGKKNIASMEVTGKEADPFELTKAKNENDYSETESGKEN